VSAVIEERLMDFGTLHPYIATASVIVVVFVGIGTGILWAMVLGDGLEDFEPSLT
jgi:hypothetical protein